MYRVIALLLIIACNHQKEKININKNLNLFKSEISPDLNKSYSYQIGNITEINQNVNDENHSNRNEMTLEVSYVFKRDSLGHLLASIQFDKFIIHVQTEQVDQELNASTALSALGPSERVFAAFDKAKITAQIDSLGQVISISGNKEILNKMYALSGKDPEALKMLNGSVQKYVSEAFFRQTIEQNLKLFNKKTLEPGEEWEQVNPVDAEINAEVKTKYKFVSLQDGLANFEYEGKIDLEEQPITVEGKKVTATLKGKQSGYSNIDIATGMTKSAQSTLKLKGTLYLMGREVDLNISTESSIKLIN